MTPIHFRPHHFLCTLGFQGKGYSPSFVANYQEIHAQLHSANGDNTSIHVVAHTDSICAPCPHKRDLNCAAQEKITRLDQLHAEVLAIKPGDVLTWGEGKQRIKEKMTLEKFHTICESCEWKKYGMCEKTLRHFLEE
jgi:hypothetical protein